MAGAVVWSACPILLGLTFLATSFAAASEPGVPRIISNGGGRCEDVALPPRFVNESSLRRWLAGLSSCAPGTLLVFTWSPESERPSGPFGCSPATTALRHTFDVTVASAGLDLLSSSVQAESSVTDLMVEVDDTSTGSFETHVVPAALVTALSQATGSLTLDFNKLRQICEQLGIDLTRSARYVLTELKNRGLFTDEALAALFLVLEENGLFLDESALALFLAAVELSLFVEVTGAALYAFCTGQGISIDLFAQEIARFVETHAAEVKALLHSMNLQADTAQFVRSVAEGGGQVESVLSAAETGSTRLSLEVERESYEPRATVEKSVRQAAAVPLGRLDYDIDLTIGPAPPSAVLIVDVLPPEVDVLRDAAEELEFPPRVYRDKAAKRTYVIWYLDDSHFVGEEGRWGATFHLPVRVLIPPLLPRTDLDQ